MDVSGQFADHLLDAHISGIDDNCAGGHLQGGCAAGAVARVPGLYAGEYLIISSRLAGLKELLVTAPGSGSRFGVEEELDLGMGKNNRALIAALGDQGGERCGQLPLAFDHFIADAPAGGDKVGVLGYLDGADELGDVPALDTDLSAVSAGDHVQLYVLGQIDEFG